MKNKSGGEHNFKGLDKIFYFVALIYFLSILAYFGWLGYHGNIISSDSGDWGTFGDFIGGVTNPIIALAILFFVIQSYRSNKLEMHIIKDEMKKQREISVYGEFLTFYRSENQIIKNIADKNIEAVLKLEKIIMVKTEELRISIDISKNSDNEKLITKSYKKIHDIIEEQEEHLKIMGNNRDKIDVYIQKLEELLN